MSDSELANVRDLLDQAKSILEVMKDDNDNEIEALTDEENHDEEKVAELQGHSDWLDGMIDDIDSIIDALNK